MPDHARRVSCAGATYASWLRQMGDPAYSQRVSRDTWQNFGLAALAAVTLTSVVLLLVWWPPAPPRTAPRPDFKPVTSAPAGPKSVFIGDSWVGGSDMGGVGDENFSSLVANRFGWTMDSSAIGGTGYLTQPTFGDPTRVALIRQVNADVVVLFNGVNDLDLSRHVDPLAKLPESAATTYARVAAAAGPNTHVVVFGYVPLEGTNDLFRQANRILERAAERKSFLFVDPSVNPWFDGRQHHFIGSDEFHPTDAGHRYLADIVTQRLRAAGAVRW